MYNELPNAAAFAIVVQLPVSRLLNSIRNTCSVPEQGILGPVPPGERDLTGRQLSCDLLP